MFYTDPWFFVFDLLWEQVVPLVIGPALWRLVDYLLFRTDLVIKGVVACSGL